MPLGAANTSVVTEQGNIFAKTKPENGQESIVFD